MDTLRDKGRTRLQHFGGGGGVEGVEEAKTGAEWLTQSHSQRQRDRSSNTEVGQEYKRTNTQTQTDR